MENEISKKLKLTISKMEKIVAKIEKETGFILQNDGSFLKEDNFKNQNDFEFKTHDTFRVIIGEEGYEPYTKEPFNDYFQYIRNVEESFCLRYAEDLVYLVGLLQEMDSFINISYNDFNKKNKRKILKKNVKEV